MFGKRLDQFMGRRRVNRSNLCDGECLKGNDVQSCVCPKCGYTITHERGVPCRSMTCPHCHVSLIAGGQVTSGLKGQGIFENGGRRRRSFFSRGSNISEQMNAAKDTKNKVQKDLKEKKCPAVNKDLCVGCGTCTEVCPHGTIEVAGGCAVIDASKCKGCGKCVRVCPTNAILF